MGTKKVIPEVLPSTTQLIEVGRIAAAGIPLTTEQAATYLQLAPGTLAILRCKPEGKGPRTVLAGTRPRYLKSDLDAWLASNTTRRKGSPNAGRPPRKRGGR